MVAVVSYSRIEAVLIGLVFGFWSLVFLFQPNRFRFVADNYGFLEQNLLISNKSQKLKTT
jgi:hypothetical protein